MGSRLDARLKSKEKKSKKNGLRSDINYEEFTEGNKKTGCQQKNHLLKECQQNV